MEKKELRQYIRGLKKQHTAEELKVFSADIMSRLCENVHFKEAQTVMLYCSLPDEVYTFDFIEKWRHEKNIILPTVVGDDIIPVALNEEKPFKVGDFNILEPQGERYDGGYDLIVVPGMAFDKDGNRLGRGKGYYDRFLSHHEGVYCIGVCFDFQKVDEVPHEVHDRTMNEVL